MTNLCREAAMMPMRRAIKGLRHDEIRRLKREDTDTPLCQDDNRAVAICASTRRCR